MQSITLSKRAIVKIGEYHSAIPHLAGEHAVTWRVQTNRERAQIFCKTRIKENKDIINKKIARSTLQ